MNKKKLSAAIFAGLCASAVLADQVILDDLIVDGSNCVGQDCVNGENFGFDTLRLKENNLRIKFQDTSNSGSFPSNDWQLTANDSSNGGANKFSIDDIDGGKTPFTVEAATPTNALYMDSSGYVGFGTSTPSVKLHAKMGNTPTLRLEQDGSSGFSSQTWDLAGNETNFFIRDITNGSKLPFRIEPNTPSNTLYLDSTGNVGLGTQTPDARLHIDINSGEPGLLVNNDGDANPQFIVTESGQVGIGTATLGTYWGTPSGLEVYSSSSNAVASINSATSNYASSLAFGAASSPRWLISSRNNISDGVTDNRISFYSNANGELFTIHEDGKLVIGVGGAKSTSHAISVSNGAHLTDGGVWTNASSRELKQGIANISDESAVKTLKALNPVTYSYKNSPDEIYAGFIAEEVPELVAMNDRKSLSPMDIVAVLTKVVQKQQGIVDKLEKRIDELESTEK